MNKFPTYGTPCLVKDNDDMYWRLAYSNGTGKFAYQLGYVWISFDKFKTIKIDEEES
jgi:hypothetical protein